MRFRCCSCCSDGWIDRSIKTFCRFVFFRFFCLPFRSPYVPDCQQVRESFLPIKTCCARTICALWMHVSTSYLHPPFNCYLPQYLWTNIFGVTYAIERVYGLAVQLLLVAPISTPTSRLSTHLTMKSSSSGH